MAQRILLAEDEIVLRMLVCDTLEDEDYTVDVAVDGEEALRKLEQNQYEVLILDYMMPKLTGFDVLVAARDMPNYRDTKILFLSAKSQQTEQQKILEAGADAFLPKPFSPAALVRKVRDMLNDEII